MLINVCLGCLIFPWADSHELYLHYAFYSKPFVRLEIGGVDGETASPPLSYPAQVLCRTLVTYNNVTTAFIESTIPSDVRVSRLHGVVVDHEDDMPQHRPPTEQAHSGPRQRILDILLVRKDNRDVLYGLPP